jgi:hypothetical protein
MRVLGRDAAAAAAVLMTVASAFAPSPARADDATTTVVVAAVTAGLTAGATYFVKDYFDTRRENRQLDRDTQDVLEEVKRLETRAAELEAENRDLGSETAAAKTAALWWENLIRDDQEFLKPRPRADLDRVALYEQALVQLYIKKPELVAKLDLGMRAPADDWGREMMAKAYGSAEVRADFWEIRKRVLLGLEGGVVTVAGEDQPRYVTGAENLMAVVDFVRREGGPEYVAPTLARLWGLNDEETAAVTAVLPPAK